MTTFEAALVREQGVTFAVVPVKDHVLNDTRRRHEVAAEYSSVFDQAPVVLMDSRGRTWGRPDLVRFLEHVPPANLPWKRWRLSA